MSAIHQAARRALEELDEEITGAVLRLHDSRNSEDPDILAQRPLQLGHLATMENTRAELEDWLKQNPEPASPVTGVFA